MTVHSFSTQWSVFKGGTKYTGPGNAGLENDGPAGVKNAGPGK